MDRILEVDLESARVTVQPGVTNLAITGGRRPHGFFYAPDPSSQQVCTIGGNVAENSGGAHCLKHGFTVHHVLEAEVVLPDGELVRLRAGDPGPDLLGAFIGSEGTLGIATEVVVRVLRRPEAVRTLLAGFDSTDHAGAAVSGVIAARILPAAIEMMDRLTIEAAEAAVHPLPGRRRRLIVELDGLTMQVEHDLAAVRAAVSRPGPWRSAWRPTTEQPALARAQIGVRGHGPVRRLLRARRRRPANAPARVLRHYRPARA